VIVEPSQVRGQELRDQVVKAIRSFYSIPRILLDVMRFRFYEASIKTLNRREMLRACVAGKA